MAQERIYKVMQDGWQFPAWIRLQRGSIGSEHRYRAHCNDYDVYVQIENEDRLNWLPLADAQRELDEFAARHQYDELSKREYQEAQNRKEIDNAS